MKFFGKIKVLSICFLTSLATVLAIRSFKCEVSLAAKDSKNEITIFPTFYEMHLSPGEKLQFSGTINNGTDKNLNIEIAFNDLNVENFVKNGFFSLVEKPTAKYPSTWLSTTTENFILEAKTSKIVNFSIEIPREIELQGYYPVIIYRIKTQEGSVKNLGAEGEITSLIYLDIRSGIKKTNISYGSINTFSVKEKFVFKPHAEFHLIFENIGKTYMHPRGKIYIYDNKGKRLSNTPTVNDKFVYLLQGQKLEETLKWEPKYQFSLIPHFGKYTAKLEITHNPSQPFISTAETTFYVIPIFHLICLILILSLFSITIFLLIKAIKGRLRIKKI